MHKCQWKVAKYFTELLKVLPGFRMSSAELSTWLNWASYLKVNIHIYLFSPILLKFDNNTVSLFFFILVRSDKRTFFLSGKLWNALLLSFVTERETQPAFEPWHRGNSHRRRVDFFTRLQKKEEVRAETSMSRCGNENAHRKYLRSVNTL